MSAITVEDEAASFAAADSIAATINLYVEAARAGDGAAMRKPFLATAPASRAAFAASRSTTRSTRSATRSPRARPPR